MSTPTNIPETPMSETEQASFFESKEKFQQQLQDIFHTIMRLTAPDQFDQLFNGWSTNSTSPLMTSMTILAMIQKNLTPKAQLLNSNGKGR